ncbi:recombinase family protein [Corynebacterium pseudotuberculosis]|uniref:recombinase family protein n=1 Tax=Corynebacterium pseudotuberculosis TaxID=1719 RepID=UPI0034EE49C4
MQQFHGHRVTYLRVSSKDQKLDRQREMLASVLPQKEFSDQASGRANAPRPGLESCMNYLRDGDQLHISSIDRLARSLIDPKLSLKNS